MAAIQPKNTTDIKADNIDEKTAAAGVDLNGSVKVNAAGAIEPLTANIDLGTTTAAEHFREVFAKEVSSDGQALSVGTISNNNLELKQTDLTRFALSNSALETDATNGVSIVMSKASTAVATKHVSGISAAGSAIGDATDLTGQTNRVTTVSASQGVQLWDAPIGTRIEVWNSSGTTVNVYPHSGSGTINGGAAGAAKTIATVTIGVLIRKDATDWDMYRWAVATP